MVPGRVDRTIGSVTCRPRARGFDLRTCSTPRRINAFAGLPSSAARALSRRYIASGISMVVRTTHSAIFMAVTVMVGERGGGTSRGRVRHVSRRVMARRGEDPSLCRAGFSSEDAEPPRGRDPRRGAPSALPPHPRRDCRVYDGHPTMKPVPSSSRRGQRNLWNVDPPQQRAGAIDLTLNGRVCR